MKKISLLTITAGVLALASCKNETATVSTEGLYTQGQVDSMIDARLEELRQQMALENDSIIQVRAMELADSIVAAKSGKPVASTPSRPAVKTTTTKPKTTTTTPKPTTPAPTGKGNGESGSPTGKSSGNEGQPTGKNK